MISNSSLQGIAILEITNEMPLNRLGGVGSVIDSLIQGFETLGVRVLWFLVDHHYTPEEVDRLLASFPHVAIGTADELETLSAPVAHLHTYNHNLRLLDHLRGKRIILTIHSLLRCEAEFNGVDLGRAIARQEALIARCHQVVLVSHAELWHYQRLGYMALNDRVCVIHNGLACPARQNRHNGSRRLGFCGRLVPRKRPEYVQLILKERGFEEYISLVAGRGFSAYSRHLMEDAELQHRVRYLGWCAGARLEAFYQAIELLVIPSVYEPFGMVALEAMARGVPVLCTPIGGLVEILGEEAVFMADCHYESFRKAMWQWRGMATRDRQAMVETARHRYHRHFTDVAMARRYRSLFVRLA